MSAQHTQGRLVYSYRGREINTYGVRYCDISTVPIASENDVIDIVRHVLAPDARRLVACWNACENLATEFIEKKRPVHWVTIRALLEPAEKLDSKLTEAEAQLAAASALLEEVIVEVPADYSDELTERIRAFLKGQP